MIFEKNATKVTFSLLFFLLSLLSFNSLFAISTTFTGAADNNWNNSSNWTNGVPGSSDDAIILAGNVTISSTGTIIVQSLLVQSGGVVFLSGTGGVNTFTVTGTTTVQSGGFIFVTTVHNSFGGTITMDAGASIQIQTAGRLNASGDVIVNGSLSGVAGDLNFGTLTINGNMQLGLAASGVDISGGSITINNSAYIDFNNRPSTTVTLTGDFNNSSGLNDGIRNTNNVTFIANASGTQTFTGGGFLTETFFGNLTVNAISTLELSNYNNVTGTLTNNGTISLPNASAVFTIASSATVARLGTVNSNSGNFAFTNLTLATTTPVTTINLAGGSFTGTSLIKSGTSAINVTGSTAISLSSFTNNGGTLDLGASTVTFNGVASALGGSQSTTFYDLVVGPGAALTGTSSFTIANSFTNSGNASTFSSGTATFSAGGIGIIDGGSNGTRFNNMTIQDGAAISIANKVDLAGVLTLQGLASTFDADGAAGTGVFTVKSTSQTAGGQIANLPAPANFTGNLVIERYLHSGGVNGDYRYLSVPINTAITPVNLSLWKSTFGVTGNFTDPSDYAVTDGGGNFASIQSVNKTTPSVSTYTGTAYSFLANAGNPVSSVALSGTTGYVAYNYASSPVTISYPGEIQKGSMSIPISSTNLNFNLIPNPYPATIDWDNIAGTGLTSAMYLRNSGSVITTYVRGGSITNPPVGSWQGEIAIGQCFWTQSTGGSSSLSLDESAKNTASNNSIFVRDGSTKPSAVRVQLLSKTQRDEAIIQFVENATDLKDDKFDAAKFKNGILISPIGRNSYLNVSSFNTESNLDLAINSIAPLATNLASKAVGLKVSDVEKGDYTLNISTENFALGYSIVLKDKFLNKQLELKSSISYSFAVTDNPESFGDKRFVIDFVQAITAVLDEPESGFQIYPNPVVKDKLTIVTPALLAGKVKSISVLDMSGRALSVEDQIDSSEVTFDVSSYNPAVYVVSIKLSNGIFKSYRIIKR